MSYSTIFHTVYDQPAPVGVLTLGHGNHYSVLSCPQWRGVLNEDTLGEVRNQMIGVIWDEDHDTRVIRVLERAYINHLMAPVMFVGERRAKLRVVVQDDLLFGEDYLAEWRGSVLEALADSDDWGVEIVCLKDVGSHGLIVADKAVVNRYLGVIRDLWAVGELHYSW